MSTFDDYEDEMRELRGVSERDIDRLMSGKATADGNAVSDLAGFLTEVPEALEMTPEAHTRRAHLTAIVAAASQLEGGAPVAALAGSPSSGVTWRSVVTRTRAFALRLIAITGAAVMSMAGLAFAGVDLPGTTAEHAIETILQFDLPNQDGAAEESKSRSDEVEDAKESFGDARGCGFGKAVSEAASGNNQSGHEGVPQIPCARGNEDKVRGKSGDAHGNAKGKDEDKVRGKSGDAHGNAKGKDEDKVRGKSGDAGNDAPGRDDGKVRGKSGDAGNDAPGRDEDKVRGKSGDTHGNSQGKDDGTE